MMPERNLRRQVAAMPKVDLHRHLEGSIRLQTLVEIAREYRIPLPSYEVDGLRPYVQMMANDPRNLDLFLGKFSVLRQFYRSPEIIRRITAEVVADAAADNVRYLELRFTPSTLASQIHCSIADVIAWVCEAAQQAGREHGVMVRLIVSMNRHESPELALRALDAALAARDKGVVGLDLAGRETGFPARPFGPMFFEGKQAGLGITVHAGEWQGSANVRDAIEHMGADRIGHGVRVVEDSRVVALARERGVIFEVCPTSNVQSGVVSNIRHHPLIDMYYLGLKTTINTDDPTISDIVLSDEFMVAARTFHFSFEALQQHVLKAVDAAFLPADQKAALRAAICREMGLGGCPTVQSDDRSSQVSRV
jgi:adenosine deaminase